MLSRRTALLSSLAFAAACATTSGARRGGGVSNSIKLVGIDSFDAMTSVRPYRTHIADNAADLALVELQAGMGTRYWPEAVEGFTDLYRTGKLDHIVHYFNDDVPLPAFEQARDDQFDAIRLRHSPAKRTDPENPVSAHQLPR